MPIYEYKCDNCQVTIEVTHNINQKFKEKCKLCGGNFKKIISHNSFILKGDRWAKDNYSPKKYETSKKIKK